jgi:LPXTG-motif cell wall-anchored protein
MPAEDNNALSAVGLLLLIISAAMVFGYLKRKTRQEKQGEAKVAQ